jgi:hypothetical protein
MNSSGHWLIFSGQSCGYSILWIASEICYYLGLISAALFLPAITFILWVMSLVDRADPNYWYLLIAWGFSVLIFLVGVGIKRRIR